MIDKRAGAARFSFLKRQNMRKIGLIVLFIALSLPALSAAAGLTFDELYDFGILGMSFTDKVKSLEGEVVSMDGFMAPPLKAKGNFFVLTKSPVSLCPFCNSDADWPQDIVVVYLDKSEIFRQHNRTIRVTGKLELGSYTDPETGFVSQMRLVGAEYEDV